MYRSIYTKSVGPLRGAAPRSLSPCRSLRSLSLRRRAELRRLQCALYLLRTPAGWRSLSARFAGLRPARYHRACAAPCRVYDRELSCDACNTLSILDVRYAVHRPARTATPIRRGVLRKCGLLFCGVLSVVPADDSVVRVCRSTLFFSPPAQPHHRIAFFWGAPFPSTPQSLRSLVVFTPFP